MYSFLLSLHSIFRWLVLIALIYAIYKSYNGWFSGRQYQKSDNTVRILSVTITHIQFLIGVILYFVSPLISYFLNNFKDAVGERSVRFFGMEHSLMMLIAVALISIGSGMAKRKPDSKQKFKAMAIFCTIGLLIILISIPWPFSPMAGRPYFRMF